MLAPGPQYATRFSCRGGRLARIGCRPRSAPAYCAQGGPRRKDTRRVDFSLLLALLGAPGSDRTRRSSSRRAHSRDQSARSPSSCAGRGSPSRSDGRAHHDEAHGERRRHALRRRPGPRRFRIIGQRHAGRLPKGMKPTIAPHLPTDTRGKPRVDDRRVISEGPQLRHLL